MISYFSCQQWKFTDHNVQALQSRMTPLDQELFDFNIARLDWQSVFKLGMQGLRIHVAKESLDNLQVAKKRYRRCVQRVLNKLLIISSSLMVHRWYSSCLLVLAPYKSGLCVVLLLLRSLSEILRSCCPGWLCHTVRTFTEIYPLHHLCFHWYLAWS